MVHGEYWTIKELFVYPNEYIYWSVQIVMYPFMTGLVAGAFVLSSLYHVFDIKQLRDMARFALVFSFALLFVAPMPIVLHLQYPLRGINVFMTRYVNVIAGGLIAGIGGAYFTIGSVGRFDKLMTAGKGFIGLAAMIFGNWNPLGALGSSLIFGFADSLQVKMQILKTPIPSEFLQMAPYIITIIVVAGLVGNVHTPAADGAIYEKQ